MITVNKGEIAFELLFKESKNIAITYKGKAAHDLQLQGLIKLGFGVTVIPESYIQQDDSLTYIDIHLDDPIERPIVLAYRQLPQQIMHMKKTLPYRLLRK